VGTERQPRRSTRTRTKTDDTYFFSCVCEPREERVAKGTTLIKPDFVPRKRTKPSAKYSKIQALRWQKQRRNNKRWNRSTTATSTLRNKDRKKAKQSKSFLVPQQVSQVMSSESGDCKVSTKPEKRGSNKQKENLNSDTSQKICHRDDEAKKKTKLRQKQTENCAPKTQKQIYKNPQKKKLIREGIEGEKLKRRCYVEFCD